MTEPTRVVLGLGSNVGGRASILRAARALLARELGADVALSRAMDTTPVGPPQPRYLNAAALAHTRASPQELLALALGVERALGRERREKWGPRTLDVDVLWIDGAAVDAPGLRVPHPALRERAFALAPLLELAPDARDPRDGRALAERLAALTPADDPPAFSLGEAFATTYIDHTADEGFVVHATDRADALAGAAEALSRLVVDPASVAPASLVEVRADAPGDGFVDDEERAFAWLSEVLYQLDGKRFAVHRAAVLGDDAAGVRGILLGEPLDEARHAVKGAVKAVTYHAMAMGPAAEGGYRAQVVVDV